MGHSERYDEGFARASRTRTIPARSSSASRSRTSATPPTSCARCSTRPSGQDGYVSFELPPELAVRRRRAPSTPAEALLRGDRQGQRPHQGARAPRRACEAFEELTARGVSVNVTLLFDVGRYEEIAEAYVRGLRAPRAGRRADRPDRVGRELLRLARGRQGRRRAGRERRPARPQGQGGGRQREDRLRVVPADLLRRALGRAGGQGRQRPAPAVGVDVDEEPRLPRHALRRRADRARHRQHDARRDDRRRARPRDRRADGRQDVDGAHRVIEQVRAAGIDFDDIVSRQLVDEGVKSFADVVRLADRHDQREGRVAVSGGAVDARRGRAATTAACRAGRRPRQARPGASAVGRLADGAALGVAYVEPRERVEVVERPRRRRRRPPRGSCVRAARATRRASARRRPRRATRRARGRASRDRAGRA